MAPKAIRAVRKSIVEDLEGRDQDVCVVSWELFSPDLKVLSLYTTEIDELSVI